MSGTLEEVSAPAEGRAEAYAAMLAELERLEWSQAGGCPACLEWRLGADHKPGCTLKAALDLARGKGGRK